MKKTLFIALLLWAHAKVHGQHAHLNVGAVGMNQNDQLTWANGEEFEAQSDYVKTLIPANSGRFAGYYEGNITLTALPATAEHAGPHPAAPALGSYIQFRIACLESPRGGEFGFWDPGATAPSISLTAGQESTNLWRLTESDGSPGSDPYGHIHGRRFTATKAGIYKIGFVAVDTSENGVGGSAIHTPTPQLLVWFQADVNIQSANPDIGGENARIRFGARAGYLWQMEGSTNLNDGSFWASIGLPVEGTDKFVEVLDPAATKIQKFYRARGTEAILPKP